MHGLTLAVIVACLACGCTKESIAETDGAFYTWDESRVLCGVGLDDVSGNGVNSFIEGMNRALERREVLVVFGHKPGIDHSLDKLEAVLSAANGLDLPFITFKDLLDPDTPAGPGIALTFDDTGVDQWYGIRELLADYGARVTFFVTRFHKLGDERISMLHELRADGHAIEAHGRHHLDAPEYVEEHGMQAYVDDELVPSIEVMREAGFEPRSFAYPFGSRTPALDRVVLDHVALVRSVSWTLDAPFVSDPCP
jgi:hypothetical protein